MALATNNVIELAEVTDTLTKAQQKSMAMVISAKASRYMMAGLSGQTSIGMALLQMFNDNDPANWIGNGSASGTAQHRTICTEYNKRIQSEFDVSRTLVSETWKACLDNPMLLELGAVVDTGTAIQIDMPTIEKVFKARKANGFIIRIFRPGKKGNGALPASCDSARNDTVDGALALLQKVESVLDENEAKKLRVKYADPDDASKSKSEVVQLTEAQLNNIVNGAIGILRKYRPMALADLVLNPGT